MVVIDANLEIAAASAATVAELDSARTLVERTLKYSLPPDWPYSSWDSEMCIP